MWFFGARNSSISSSKILRPDLGVRESHATAGALRIFETKKIDLRAPENEIRDRTYNRKTAVLKIGHGSYKKN